MAAQRLSAGHRDLHWNSATRWLLPVFSNWAISHVAIVSRNGQKLVLTGVLWVWTCTLWFKPRMSITCRLTETMLTIRTLCSALSLIQELILQHKCELSDLAKNFSFTVNVELSFVSIESWRNIAGGRSYSFCFGWPLLVECVYARVCGFFSAQWLAAQSTFLCTAFYRATSQASAYLREPGSSGFSVKVNGGTLLWKPFPRTSFSEFWDTAPIWG
jgi:hypothetical protein